MSEPRAEPIASEVLRPWRVGRRVGRTIYMILGNEPSDHDVLIGVMDSPEIADEAVVAHNMRLGARRANKEAAERAVQFHDPTSKWRLDGDTD